MGVWGEVVGGRRRRRDLRRNDVGVPGNSDRQTAMWMGECNTAQFSVRAVCCASLAQQSSRGGAFPHQTANVNWLQWPLSFCFSTNQEAFHGR